MINEFENMTLEQLDEIVNEKEDFYEMSEERQQAFLTAYRDAIMFEEDFIVESVEEDSALNDLFMSEAFGGESNE